MLVPPTVPDWIRRFSYPDWTNVFQLSPNTRNLYPEALRPEWKTQFNDWNGKILLLAKDGCPTRVIREACVQGESQPWRYAQQELGDEGGWRTNNRLCRFALAIPGGKLYGSAAANMLCDHPEWSRSLPGFFEGPLHEFLKRVLSWVLESMPRVKWVACLGREAWFLTCVTLGDTAAASSFGEYRDSYRPVIGFVGGKQLAAFPLYHPGARVRTDLMERGWQELARSLSVPRKTAARETDRTRQRTPPTPRNFVTRNAAPEHRAFVTATLSVRECRVQFMLDNKLVHISPQYKSRNTWAKIIGYARTQRGGAPANLSRAAVAIPQVSSSSGWIAVDE